MGWCAVTDLESRAQPGDHQALRLWLRMLSCTTRIEDALRQRLRQRFGTTLPRFDLLAQLDRFPEGLTMRALSQRLMVTGGNVTGVVDQLEAEGWARRTAHPQDRRAILVQLTPAGRRQFRKMAAEHEAWVVELLGHLSPAQTQQMHVLLSALKPQDPSHDSAH
ncbi:MAG: MarR family transcriptional regulator [Proteobacteria bacterium]|nr:MarR family transcriptional regulator [Pseudomonadota bacterium]